MIKTRYKAGDVLTTRMGKVFTITGIAKVTIKDKGQPPVIIYNYSLSGHSHLYLKVDYIDNAEHLCLATDAGKILYGTCLSVIQSK